MGFRLVLASFAALLLTSLWLPFPHVSGASDYAVQPLPAVTTRDPRFGIVQSIQAPDLALQAGATWERIIFPWSQMEPRPGAFEQGYFSDSEIRAQVARGFTEVGVIVYTPDWAAADPRKPHPKSVPRNLYRPWNDPDNYWGRFTGRLAERYRGIVDHWIIWNEPDLYDPTGRWFFDGSFEDYYQLLKVAYQAIKANNPRATVILGGLAYWYDKWYDRPPYLASLLEVAARDPSARDNNWYFDVVAVHAYANPLNSYAEPMIMRRILEERGIEKPIWIVESNAVPGDDPLVQAQPGPYRATLEQQASYIIQSFALGVAAGVERQGVYKMLDERPENGQYFGLMRNDGTLRPAYVAYQVAASYLSDATWAAYTWGTSSAPPSREAIDALLDSNRHRPQFIWPDPINRVVVERGSSRTTVVWNASNQPVRARIPAAAPYAALVNQEGGVGEIRARDGYYVLDLPPTQHNADPHDRSIFLIGGRPWILVESVVPLPERIHSRIEMIWPHDGAPITEARQANVTVQLLNGDGTEPVPCRWEPRVLLWRNIDDGPPELVGEGYRRMVKRNGITYPLWEFDNVDVSPARGGHVIKFSASVEGMPVDPEYRAYGELEMPPPRPDTAPDGEMGPEGDAAPPAPVPKPIYPLDPPPASCR